MFDSKICLYNILLLFPETRGSWKKSKIVYSLANAIDGKLIGETSWDDGVFFCKIADFSVSITMGVERKLEDGMYKFSAFHDWRCPKLVITVNGSHIVFGKAGQRAVCFFEDSLFYFLPHLDQGIRRVLFIFGRIFFQSRTKYCLDSDYVLPRSGVPEKYKKAIFLGIILYRMIIDGRDFS